jgi:hypothetical protein
MGILLAGSSKLYLNRSKSRLNISYTKCIDRSSKYSSAGCARLGRLYAETGRRFHFSKEGPKLFTFLTRKGREGLRFGRRIWEGQANIGRNRQLLVVICKKWHVAKRLVVRIGGETDVEAVLYLFHEHNSGCPNLGGIENRVPKRG